MRMRDRMYYTVQTLGRTRSVTPDGYLLCEAVPIARTGEQVYGEDEIELPGLNGMVRVERPESEVFKAETIASFEGKPITLEHPGDFVTPLNHRQHSVGHVQNVRRGEGVDSDLMLADLLITEETSRAATVLQQTRAEHVGSTGYVWETAHDSTVRPSHKAMQGQFVRWDAPPTLDELTGHAGALPNCRCWPRIVLPATDVRRTG